jgi:hypothetical protein
MTQYDAGPGDLSDREWEAPERKPVIHARRRGPKLPPWGLLAIAAAAVILLCVGAVLVINALGGGSDADTTPGATATRFVVPLGTQNPTTLPTGPTLTPSPTVELPSLTLTLTPSTFSQIAPGATVTVTGVGVEGLNVRASATITAEILETVDEGTTLLVLSGPKESDGYTWWQVRTPAGTEGWAVADYMVLKPSP